MINPILYICIRLLKMVYPIKTLQIEADQRSEIVFALAHHCSVSLRIVVAD